MTKQQIAAATKEIEVVVKEIEALQQRSAYDDLSDLPISDIQQSTVRAHAVIDRTVGRMSSYWRDSERVGSSSALDGDRLVALKGLLGAIREDFLAGFVRTLTETIHADLFSDFLEMAEHLAAEGYKDAAAVIAGGALEVHIRQLCQKYSIPTEQGGRPKKADQMNAELAQANAYSKLDQKSVTAWLDLRNKAAHAKYLEYNKDQVELFIAALREFLTRLPA